MSEKTTLTLDEIEGAYAHLNEHPLNGDSILKALDGLIDKISHLREVVK